MSSFHQCIISNQENVLRSKDALWLTVKDYCTLATPGSLSAGRCCVRKAVLLMRMHSTANPNEPAHIQQARQQLAQTMAAQPELLAAGMQALDLASAAFVDAEQVLPKLEASRRRVAELEQIVASTKHIRNGRKNRNHKWRQQLQKLRSILTSATASEKNKIRSLLSTIDFWLATGQARESSEPEKDSQE